MQFHCAVRVNRTRDGWNSDILDTPTFSLDAQNPEECFKKINSMYYALLIPNDTIYMSSCDTDGNVNFHSYERL